ncbi:hypothetical protein FGO68_gene15033 [Halteria grandinella]|uniref:Uncharacterized protein n=1 Tax=Halteria grandinella TaxID=5974 RepID=A0A8J8NB29_HALGN|nr:hypothetical protein FGO68_gene15033 [Halteria grandinella]
MKYVRDNAIGACDMMKNPKSKSVDVVRWRQMMKSDSIDELLKEIIPHCVDQVIFYLLHSIDQELLPLSFTTSSGKCVNLTTEGKSEMAGYCVSGGGLEDDWRARFSKERFNYDEMPPLSFDE